jgi:hypothetical protein
LERTDEALDVFSLGARVNPFSSDVRFGMARAAVRLGEPARAQIYLREALRRNPDKRLPEELAAIR